MIWQVLLGRTRPSWPGTVRGTNIELELELELEL